MGMEIERKFTVKRLPEGIDGFEYRIIEQAYLTVEPAISRGEITLIEVIAHDERLKRHTLKLRVDCTVRANFSEPYGQRRHAVEPVERMGGSFHLLGSEDKLKSVVLARPEIAVTVQDFQPCPAV